MRQDKFKKTNSTGHAFCAAKYGGKYGVMSFALLLALPASVSAQNTSFDITCTNSQDIRQILVVAPGEKGKACDVIYTKNRGLNSSTPYYANTDVGYCLDKAVSLRERLVSASYQCRGEGTNRQLANVSVKKTLEKKQLSSAAPTAILSQSPVRSATETQKRSVSAQASSVVNLEATQSGAIATIDTDEDLTELSNRDAFLARLKKGARAPTPAFTDVPEDDQDPVLAAGPENNENNENNIVPQIEEPVVPAPAQALVDAQRANIQKASIQGTDASNLTVPASLGVEDQSSLEESEKEPVLSAPVTLVSQEVDSLEASERVPGFSDRDPAYRISRSVVADKLVGATPEAADENRVSKLVIPNRQALSEEQSRELASNASDVASQGVSAPTNAGFLSSVLSKADADKPRSRPDIIRATLAAQAAAWNEGDIEAFMDGYWRDSNLRFVSGTEVTKGWNTTLNRYKKRYGDGAALGQLTFSEMDVQMLSEDVAIVVGRFNLDRSDGLSSGLYTLVVKRFEGAWRIVHDHTVADPVEVIEPDSEITAN